MAFFQEKLFFSLFLFFFSCMIVSVSSHSRYYTPPTVPRLTSLLPYLSIDQAFSASFGGSNIQLRINGSSADITLNKTSGSGLISRYKYHYGFFSAAIKLPSGLSSGVVVAFYLSNTEVFPHAHDEIDIELLGHDKRNDWVIQTNIYANGKVSTGREEKFYLWFDPTVQHHEYTIIWNNHHIVFLVDNVPVRQFPNTGAFSSVYPSKPMSVYATIWDGSQWATHGGKYPVNYKYAPFIASFSDIKMGGCRAVNDPKAANNPSCSVAGVSKLDPVEGEEFVRLSQEQISAMDWARRKLMFYSYCNDKSRYKVLPQECN